MAQACYHLMLRNPVGPMHKAKAYLTGRLLKKSRTFQNYDNDLRVEKAAELITREDIVNNHRRPVTVLTQPQLIDTLSTELTSHHDRLQQLRPLSDHWQRAHEPSHAVTNQPDYLPVYCWQRQQSIYVNPFTLTVAIWL